MNKTVYLFLVTMCNINAREEPDEKRSTFSWHGSCCTWPLCCQVPLGSVQFLLQFLNPKLSAGRAIQESVIPGYSDLGHQGYIFMFRFSSTEQ